jgi:hypothetical protein
MEMGSWMDAFYQELVTTSEVSEEEACKVVGAYIRKMFKEIQFLWAQVSNATYQFQIQKPRLNSPSHCDSHFQDKGNKSSYDLHHKRP